MTSTIRGDDGFDSLESKGIGHDQTWQSVTRSSGTPYTNDTGRPILVRAFTSVAASSVDISLTVDGVLVEYTRFSVAGNTGRCSVSAIIPDGSTYTYAIGAGSFSFVELR